MEVIYNFVELAVSKLVGNVECTCTGEHGVGTAELKPPSSSSFLQPPTAVYASNMQYHRYGVIPTMYVQEHAGKENSCVWHASKRIGIGLESNMNKHCPSFDRRKDIVFRYGFRNWRLLRESKGMNYNRFRRHCGEVGDIDHLAAAGKNGRGTIAVMTEKLATESNSNETENKAPIRAVAIEYLNPLTKIILETCGTLSRLDNMSSSHRRTTSPFSLSEEAEFWVETVIFRRVYYLDTSGYAFIYPLARLFGCKVVIYKHYPTQSASTPSPQTSNMFQPHYSSQPPPVVQPTISAASTPLQPPLHMSSMPQMPLQPPLPSQPRPLSMPPYPHQNYSHMGPNADYQHPGAPQLNHSQPMFHRIPVTLSSENTELKLQLQAIEQQAQLHDLAYYSHFPSKVEGLSATSIKGGCKRMQMRHLINPISQKTKQIEVLVRKIHCISWSASRTEAEFENLEPGKQVVRVNLDTLLDNIVLAMRTPARQAVFRYKGQVKNALAKVEQLFSNLTEDSDTPTNLCEYTGLDVEMEIIESYSEVMDIVDILFIECLTS
ncbi:hypothetical protein CTI12_AA322660 [Artemisia annua]|uniref:Uncharacterized protein n=1 Tax=Artemisia annua TaxID=35608 RepID=A0A2U1N0G6_ARTAN|nr:hypothetical protein CTI12_AA322660 [Artemisia annua]